MAQAPKLTDFDPVLTAKNVLLFNCPNCKGEDAHRIRVPLAPQLSGRQWGHTGDLSNLTLHNEKTPENPNGLSSVDAGCWHGMVTNGMLYECGKIYD